MKLVKFLDCFLTLKKDTFNQILTAKPIGKQ